MDAIALGATRTRDGRRPVAWWLLACCLLVAGMIALGGLTRLTESGLSMVEWKPLTVLPPLSPAEWQAEFEAYRQYPQYRLVNAGMGLADFQQIYWLEYLHRLAGRLVGFVFLVPFLVFWAQGRLDRRLALRLVGLFCLGGLQGLVGWLMVKSGLVDRPDVSPYRLAAHLGIAVALLGLLLWTALDLLHDGDRPGRHPLAPAVAAFAGLVLLTLLAGAFVAGLDAGRIYASFPLMGDGLVPGDYAALSPWWRNTFENAAAVQFHHRLLAVATVAAAAALGWAGWRRGIPALLWLPAVALGQAALGIATLLGGVPVALASAHQMGAVLLFSLTLLLAHRLRRSVPVEVGGAFGR